MVRTGRGRWGRALALGMGAGVLPAALLAPPLWAQEARIGYDIPSQPLARALMRFSQVSGMQVFFDPAALRGKTSPGAQGALTRGQALAALKEHGMQINEVSPEEIQRMREQAQPAIQTVIDAVGQELFDQVQAEVEKAAR